MVLRAILLIAIGAFLIPAIACAESGPMLPSRKAEVVVPLLTGHTRLGHERKEVLLELAKILGAPSSVSPPSTGIEGTYIFYDYLLDDADRIEVLFVNDGFISINLISPNNKATYLAPK